MRPVPARARRFVPLAIACSIAFVLAPAVCGAQDAERFNLSAFTGYGVERFNSLGADSLGITSNSSPESGLLVDFRVVDLPVGKTGAKPALHLTGGVSSSTRILGPPVQGMVVGVYPVVDLAAGVLLELPVDVLFKGNSGVALRMGWNGAFLLTRSNDQSFLSRSKSRFDFVRTTGALAGSLIGYGKGVDEAFGWDASHKRSDVHLSLQGRIIGSTPYSPPPPVKPGAKPSPPKPAGPTQRLMWIFADVSVDTDGGPGADGMHARVGLGFDVSAFTTAAFAPKH